MAENSKIEWTHHTFNPWRGCTKVSDGCKNCYAETMSKRFPGTLGKWGPLGDRVVASESYWHQPLKWDRLAREAGERHRVFCASLADVFEGQDTMPKAAWDKVQEARQRLFALAYQTKWLDWLFLTKRPENVPNILSSIKHPSYPHTDWWRLIERQPRPNWWFGTSCENQETADERIPHLLRCPAAVRFLSCEPLLGPVDIKAGFSKSSTLHICASVEGMLRGRQFDHLNDDDGKPMSRREAEEKLWALHAKGVKVIPCSKECVGFSDQDGCPGHPDPRINWVICGGESGPGARPVAAEWARSLRDQCVAANVPYFFKQWGEHAPLSAGLEVAYRACHENRRACAGMPLTGKDIMFRVGKKAAGRLLDGVEWSQFPGAAPVFAEVSA